MEEMMLLKKTLLVTSTTCLFVLSGCQKRIQPSHLSSIRIGMSKNEVIRHLGEPEVQRGSMMNNFNQVIDVYEYLVNRGPTDQQIVACTFLVICSFGLLFPLYFLTPTLADPYWMFFCNDRLEKWCKAGDWETTQHNIQEIRFR